MIRPAHERCELTAYQALTWEACRHRWAGQIFNGPDGDIIGYLLDEMARYDGRSSRPSVAESPPLGDEKEGWA